MKIQFKSDFFSWNYLKWVYGLFSMNHRLELLLIIIGVSLLSCLCCGCQLCNCVCSILCQLLQYLLTTICLCATRPLKDCCNYFVNWVTAMWTVRSENNIDSNAVLRSQRVTFNPSTGLSTVTLDGRQLNRLIVPSLSQLNIRRQTPTSRFEDIT